MGADIVMTLVLALLVVQAGLAIWLHGLSGRLARQVADLSAQIGAIMVGEVEITCRSEGPKHTLKIHGLPKGVGACFRRYADGKLVKTYFLESGDEVNIVLNKEGIDQQAIKAMIEKAKEMHMPTYVVQSEDEAKFLTAHDPCGRAWAIGDEYYEICIGSGLS